MNITETDPEHLASAMDRLQATWAAEDARLAALPQAQDCPTHGANSAKLDRENSRPGQPATYICHACEVARKAAPGPIGRAEIEAAGIAPTGIHNHLKFLERHGLIKRAGRKSQGILWRAVEM